MSSNNKVKIVISENMCKTVNIHTKQSKQDYGSQYSVFKGDKKCKSIYGI